MNLERIQVYEEAFAKVQAATGISDIDELVETFLNAEEQVGRAGEADSL